MLQAARGRHTEHRFQQPHPVEHCDGDRYTALQSGVGPGAAHKRWLGSSNGCGKPTPNKSGPRAVTHRAEGTRCTSPSALPSWRSRGTATMQGPTVPSAQRPGGAAPWLMRHEARGGLLRGAEGLPGQESVSWSCAARKSPESEPGGGVPKVELRLGEDRWPGGAKASAPRGCEAWKRRRRAGAATQATEATQQRTQHSSQHTAAGRGPGGSGGGEAASVAVQCSVAAVPGSFGGSD